MAAKRKNMPHVPDNEWAEFRQEFGELVGLARATHEQAVKTNGTVTRHTQEIGELKTSVAVSKVKIAGVIGGALLLLDFIKSNWDVFVK